MKTREKCAPERPDFSKIRNSCYFEGCPGELFDLVKFARNKSPHFGNCDFLSKILRLREQKVWSHWMCHVPSPHFLDPVPRDHDPVVGAVLRGRGHQLHRVGLADLGQVAPYRLPVNKYELALQNKFLVLQCCFFHHFPGCMPRRPKPPVCEDRLPTFRYPRRRPAPVAIGGRCAWSKRTENWERNNFSFQYIVYIVYCVAKIMQAYNIDLGKYTKEIQ